MRIDSHQHFWHYDAEQLPWIGDEMPSLRADFLPGDLAPLLAAHGMDGTIAVQARHSVDETRWLLELADTEPHILGVVGWVDLLAPDVDERLATIAHPMLKGIRHIVQDEPEEDFLLRPDFRGGVSRLADHGLTYDLLLFPAQMRLASTLAAENPHVGFVLDHLGKPPVVSGRAPPREWRQDLRRLADHENVMCKISGMVTEAAWNEWRPEEFFPFMDVIRDAFGPERIMFGSDWPVCLLSGEYAAVFDIVEQYAAEMPADERDALFGGNAASFYGIEG